MLASNLYWGSWCDISISRLQGVPFVLCIQEFDKNFEDLDISISSFGPGKDFEVVSKNDPEETVQHISCKKYQIFCNLLKQVSVQTEAKFLHIDIFKMIDKV